MKPAYRKRRRDQKGRASIDLLEDDVVSTRADSPGGPYWGPREFLQNVFEMVASVRGDAVLLLMHNGVEVEFDAAAFAEWVRKSQESPAQALLESAAFFLPAPTK